MLEEEYNPRRKLPPALGPAPEAEPPFEYAIRDAAAADLPGILEIYNHYVLNSTVTLDEKPMTLAELRRRFAKTSEKHLPFLVAVSPRGELLGFAYVFPWKAKAAYRFTVENSIYLGPASTGKGLGKALLGEIIERSRAAGLREIIAVIADERAEASISMHEKFGFSRIGHMGKVGFKFDRWLGAVLMQKSLK
ncbi:MAG: N-acetyltransferase family protein [Rhodoglobus sp.]